MDAKELQAEIEKAEAAIKAQLERVIGLAEFSDMRLHVDVTTVERIGERPKVKVVGVRIDASL